MDNELDSQVFRCGTRYWHVTRLFQLSKDLEPFKLPLKHLNIYDLFPKINTTLGFIEEIKNVMNADLKYPIILDEEGYVMDGRHRICKALYEEKEFILAVRFSKTPECCYESKK